MINASQARILAEESDAAIEKIVNQIGTKIEEVAKLGGMELDLESAMNYDKRFEPNKPAFHAAEFTPWQRLIVQRLKNAGYQVAIKEKIVKIGGGLGSMDDEPPREEPRPFIQVRW